MFDLNTLLFGYFPYIALAVFFVGSALRFNRDQYGWRSGSSQLLRRRQLMWGSVLFHLGIIALFFGHAFGLLVPTSVYQAFGIGYTAKQLMAIIVGGVAGVACFIGLTMLIHRRLFDPRILRTSTFSDIAILLLLYFQLILGLITIPISMGHLDGQLMVSFMAWSQGIFTFQPGVAEYVADAPIIFKLHLFFGLLIFLVFPFTRLVHVWSAPVWYLGRRGYQVVRTRNGRRPA